MIDENKFLEQIKRTFDDSVLNEKRFDLGKHSLLDLLEEMIKNLVCEIKPCSERLTNHFDYCGLFECKYYDKELAKSDKCKLFDVSRKKCHERAMYEKLIAYEDLEEQGLLLKLPCKVGDAVWCLEGDDYTGYVFIAIVGEYCFVAPHYEYCTDIDEQLEEMENDTENGFEPNVSVFHKSKVFLTKAEAEAKLKEMEGES